MTGAHAFKAGIEYNWGWNDRWTTPNRTGPITSIRINFATRRAGREPVHHQLGTRPQHRPGRRYDGGVYIQDK